MLLPMLQRGALGLLLVTSTAAATPWEPSAFSPLTVPGYGDAVVSEPGPVTGAPKPVVVALHGLRGRADWTCHVARALFEGRAFVLCPAGTPLPATTAADRARPRYTFRDPPRTGQEVTAGLQALEARYGAAVDITSPALYGHSLGAIFGAPLALSAPGQWSRVLLSEGGYSAWLGPDARAFAKTGEKRVFFACGTAACFTGAQEAARALRAQGARADVGYAKGAGHRSWGPIVEVMSEKIDWLLEGDARFSPGR